MFDRLLNTNQFWLGVVCCAGIYPDCKAFMDQVKDYFTYISIHAICLSFLPAICFRLLRFLFGGKGVPMAKLKQTLGQTLNTNSPWTNEK
ncbi:hypothetical protein GPALN_010367 [Globodera pallida]|nr:hypothetical protein GPALN_010367 [Globodera pallida]